MGISPSSWAVETTMSYAMTVIRGFSGPVFPFLKGWFVRLYVFFESRGILIRKLFRRFFESTHKTIPWFPFPLSTVTQGIVVRDAALNRFLLWLSPKNTVLEGLMTQLSLTSGNIYLKITEVFLQTFVHYFFCSFHIGWSAQDFIVYCQKRYMIFH